MKKLIVSVLLIAVVLAAILIAPQVIGEKGYVLISMGSLVIEMTVVSLVISVLIAILIAWVVWRLIKAIVHLFSGSWQWFGSLSRNKRRKNFYRGIQACAEGDLEASKKAPHPHHGRLMVKIPTCIKYASKVTEQYITSNYFLRHGNTKFTNYTKPQV